MSGAPLEAHSIHFHTEEGEDELSLPTPQPQEATPAASASAAAAAANQLPSPSQPTTRNSTDGLKSETPVQAGMVQSYPAASASTGADVDYEQSGQGFIRRSSIESLHRGSGAGVGGGVEAAAAATAAAAASSSSSSPRDTATGEESKEYVAIEMTDRSTRPPAAATVARVPPTKKSPSLDDSDAEDDEEEGGEGAHAPKDAIWRLSFAQLAEKFSDSNLDVSNPRASGGLSSARAAELLEQYGRNELKPPPEPSELTKYLLQFTDPFMLMLILAGVLSSAVAYPADTDDEMNLYIGIILWVVVFLSATFAYIQEGKASDVMKSFKGMLPAQTIVIRDGREQSIPAAMIVPGDLIKITGGSVVSADARVMWTQDCKVETSSLTGESLPITCSLTSPNTLKIEQAKNVCFNSSKCLEGESLGLVFATGDQSLIGQIAGLAGGQKKEDTTLQKEIKLFVRYLSIGAVCLGVIFFAIGMARGQEWIFAFINGFIIVLIACVPEGLPMTVVTCLTITARRLNERNVFVKQLQSVETLGSVSVVATDKTGTLTKNIMAVANFWFDSTAHTADSVFQHYPPRPPRVQRKGVAPGQEDPYHPGATLEMLELIATICSKTRFEDERNLTPQQAHQLEQVETLKSMDPSLTLRRARAQYPTLYGQMDSSLTFKSGRNRMFEQLGEVMLDDAQRKLIGDASETALTNFVRQRQSIELLRYHHPKVYEVPFNSRNKYALVITKPVGLAGQSSNKRTLLMKGAPEVILARCSKVMRRGEISPIDARFKREFTEAYERFGNLGQRVLGFAMLDLPENQFPPELDAHYAEHADKIPTTDLVFVGLVSLVDPPKESVPQAVLDCHTAGIKVIMVTGDHPLTAAAIARQVNIFQPGHFTRNELATMKQIAPEEVDEDEVDAVVVTGPEIDKFSEADWVRVLSKDDIVFSRTTPQQKLQIVTHLQAMGHVVAATGDGVNDAPALKKADIGVAMGINGSDVARDAAAVILLDDDFSSIVEGVKEGRTIFDNLTKTIAYTLSHWMPEIFPILMNLAFGFPIALSAIMILTIDLFTETPPAVSLAYEPSEANVMTKPPRNSKTDRLVTWKVIIYCLLQAGAIYTAFGYLGFFLVFQYYGISSSSLFNTNYFQGTAGVDMPRWPGCLTLADGPGPFDEGSVCYDTRDQDLVLREAQTCYYAILTAGQVFHVWYCKTRWQSIFTHGLLANGFTLWGVATEICLIILIIFPPSSNSIFFTRPFPDRFWGLIVIAPVVLLLWQEGRKWYCRRHPHSFLARHVNW